MKTCFKCGLEKPRSEFYAHPQMADGLLGKCKACTRGDAKANRGQKREQYAAYEKRREKDPERKAKKAVYATRHRKKNPQKARARDRVHEAVNRGDLVPKPCACCGALEVQAHHEDYSRPLEVTWLCFKCHREVGHGQQVIGTVQAAVYRVSER